MIMIMIINMFNDCYCYYFRVIFLIRVIEDNDGIMMTDIIKNAYYLGIW